MNELKSLLEKFKRRNTSDVHVLGLRKGPHADWQIIFLSTVAITVVVVAMEVYLFFNIYRKDVFSPQEANMTSVDLVNLTKLRKMTATYQTKAAAFEKLKKGTQVPVVDPSI